MTAVEAKDGGFVVSVRRDGYADLRGEFALRVTETGLFGRLPKESAFDRCRLKLPAKKGETWELTAPTSGEKTVYVVAGEEEVEVPAGKFRAVRVDATTELPMHTSKRSTWYARDVGVVKVWYNSGGGEVTHALKSFTLGKR